MWKYFDAVLLGADLVSGHFYRCECARVYAFWRVPAKYDKKHLLPEKPLTQ
jgi:hypothetical protein